MFLLSICVFMNIPICLISVTGQQGGESGPNLREAKAYVLLDLIYLMFFASYIFKAERLRECKQISLPKASHTHNKPYFILIWPLINVLTTKKKKKKKYFLKKPCL